MSKGECFNILWLSNRDLIISWSRIFSYYLKSSGLDVSFSTTSDLFLHLLDLGIRVWHGISQVEGRDFVTCALVNSRGQSFMTSNPPQKKTKEQSNQWLKEQALLNQTEETTVQELTLTWYTLFLWVCIQRKRFTNIDAFFFAFPKCPAFAYLRGFSNSTQLLKATWVLCPSFQLGYFWGRVS